MTGSIVLSFAELEYLLGSSPHWGQRRADLGLERPESVADASAAGLASLFVRGLAAPSASEVEVDAAPSQVALWIEDCGNWLDVVCSADGSVTPGRLGFSADEHTRVYVAPLGLGCLKITGLISDVPFAEEVAELATDFIEREPSTTVIVGHEHRHKLVGFAVRHDVSGEWTVAESWIGTVIAHPTREEATHAVALMTERLLAGFTINRSPAVSSNGSAQSEDARHV